MEIQSNSLYAQMQNMSIEATQNRSEPMQTVNKSGSDFGSLLKQAVNNVNELQQEAGALRTGFERGDENISLAQTMIAAQKSGIAFDATVQVRNKFVEAYKEIMSMPV